MSANRIGCGLGLIALAVGVPLIAGPVKDPPAHLDAERTKAVMRIPEGDFRPRKKVFAAAVPEERLGWGLGENGVRAEAAWAVTKGKGVRVAILDTGIDADHPELKGQILASKDFTGSRFGAKDAVGHGTHCAGIVAMKQDGKGYVGVAPGCGILNGKVLADDGTGDFNWLAAGIDWAVEQKADVISMSLGGGPDGTPPERFMPNLRAAIRRATDAGVIVLAAAGNDGPGANTVGYPGRYPEVVAVAASDVSRHITNFSSRGSEVDVAAPGDNVVSSIPNGQFAEWDGTSMATPMAAGVAALYVADCRANGRTPTPADFRKRIETTSSTRAKVPNPNSGWGLIQAPGFVSATPTESKTLEFGRADFTADAWGRLLHQAPGTAGLTLEFRGETLLKAGLTK
jgi:subtilisin